MKLGVLAERYGFNSVFIPDHMIDFDGCRVDPWTVLAGIGALTDKIFLCPSVVDVQRCHPAKIAHIVATLDAMTRGRAGLGIGAGEAMNIIPYGLDWDKPSLRVERLREAVALIRLLWKATKKEPANYNGRYYQLNDAWLDQSTIQKPNPPIYIGAINAKSTLELVGEQGDGWLSFINTPETFRRRMEPVKTGAERVGRKLEDLDLVALVFPAFSDNSLDREKAKTVGKIYLVAEQATLKSLGYEQYLPSREYAYQSTLVSKKTIDVVVDASKNIPDELVEKFLPTTVGECIEVVDKFIKAGAKHIGFREMNRDAWTATKLISDKIIPYFKEQ